MAMRFLVAGFALLTAVAAAAQQVHIGQGSIAETVKQLKAGQYVWAPQIAPKGPMLLIVNLSTQRALLYRNGVPIAAATVSTGRPGYRTPTGVFTILQKHVEHYSSTYDNAPMPYMQRLTWKGVALHAGTLPGYPASHGCIRLPAGFAKLLYGVTSLGMTVVIIDQAAAPRIAPTPQIRAQSGPTRGDGEWAPERSPTGPLSIVVSAADKRAVVLRNGVVIGSAQVTVQGPVAGTWAYMMRSMDGAGQHWIRVALAPSTPTDEPVPRGEWQRFESPAWFRNALRSLVEPGTTIVVTADSLSVGAASSPVTVIEGEPKRL